VRIAIVGAGIAGLASAKVLDGAGHAVDVFDRVGDVGGVWSATRSYPGLRSQNNKRTYCFSDFPMPDTYPRVPSGAQVQAYLQSYAGWFGFADRIHLRTDVLSARPVPTGGWSLQLHELAANRVTDYTCDHLVVANGVFSAPAKPDYPGHDAFTAAGARLCHATEFRSLSDVYGRHVVVVGYGKSACDIAEAVSEVAASTTVVTRRVLWKMPRRVRVLGNYENLALTRLGEAGFDYLRPNRFERFYNGRGHLLRDAAFDAVQALVSRQLGLRALGLEPDGPFEQIAQSTASLVTEGFFEKVGTGLITVHRDAEITRLCDGKDVELSNGTRVRADVVVCATGFQQQVDFFDGSIREQLTDPEGNFRLYRQILPTTVPAVTFAGYNSSMVSALGAEIGAMWTAALLEGRLQLPRPEQREADIDARLTWMHRRTDGHHARGALVAPFDIHNLDEMLNDLGANISRLRRALQWIAPLDPRSYRTAVYRPPKRPGHQD
jgi:cation diffusion facilitator CzcD-associated flavoprotein CzcO